ncbi:phage tail-collar fiber domain-containing protein [Pseudomonas protegens]|uniref:phage tail-collar fiber domain-containing protein n=1 Tax=Pseudomonas protegens TaxID=380021 RepID=UPI003820226C
MGATITLAGENLIAQKQGAQKVLTAARFILANVPGLDPEKPVDRAAGKPPAAQIVGTFDVTQAGYVNPNQVVYSVMLGSDIGDFDWNWIGLESVEGVLLMVAYVPMQQKRRNQLPQQVGNNVTRNFLLMFDGAKALTGVTVDASTWQHDFTVRLAGIDERQRLANREMFGRACYFGPSLSIKRVDNVFRLAPGTAYVEGIRVVQPTAIDFPVPAEPTSYWLDVSLQRHLNNVIASWQFITNSDKADYVDEAGVLHFRVMLANWLDNTLLDTRSAEPIDGPLVEHFAARVGDYERLRARATTKEDVELGNLPNAKSDDPGTNSSEILATTKAVRAAIHQASLDLENLAERLGTAAWCDVGKQPNNVMEVGAFGLGSNAIDISKQDATTIQQTGWYTGANIINAPDSDWWLIEVVRHNFQYCQQIWYGMHTQRTLSRTQVAGRWGDWVEFYTTTNLFPSTIVPAGCVMMCAMTAPPAGYLKANGATLSRITYASLFAAIGTTFGAGDGVNTFNIPDLRAEFLRGWDDGRGADLGRGLGTWQSQEIQSHTHTMPSGHGSVWTAWGRVNVGLGQSAGTFSTDAVGGAETRPRNVALLACIKY